MTRAPEEIYEEIRSAERPAIPKDAPIAEKLTYAESIVTHYGRIESLWDEICSATLSDHDVPMWVYSAASGASNFAAECRFRAEGQVEIYRKRLASEQVSAGTT